MSIDEIRQFLVLANKNGYGNEQTQEINETDGSHTINFEQGDWKFHDNFFGGEPFGGREVIFYKNKPVWLMVYYGFLTDTSLADKAYPFLKKALLNFTDDAPYRGPAEFSESGWNYVNKIDGEFENFSGTELISLNGHEVYGAKYQGGLLDK